MDEIFPSDYLIGVDERMALIIKFIIVYFFFCSYKIVKLAFKSIIYKTDFIQSVRDELHNADEESTSNSIVTEESPPKPPSESSSSSKKGSSTNGKTKKKHTKKEKSIK